MLKNVLNVSVNDTKEGMDFFSKGERELDDDVLQQGTNDLGGWLNGKKQT